MSRNNELNYPECKFKKSLLSGKLVVISLCLLNFILLSIGGLYYKANRLKEASISESSNLQTCYDLICNTRDGKLIFNKLNMLSKIIKKIKFIGTKKKNF